MTICVVKSCHNRSEKQHKSSGVTFHRFPSDSTQASRWTKTLRLCRNEESWNATNSTRICSKHFEEKFMYTTKSGLRKLHNDAVPTKELHISCQDQNTCNHEETPSTEIQPEPSTSQENANEEEMPPIQEELQLSSPQISPTPSEEYMESIFDTPRKASLRRQLKKKTLLHIKHAKLIKSLQQQNRLLKKRNKSLKENLIILKRRLHRRDIINTASSS